MNSNKEINPGMAAISERNCIGYNIPTYTPNPGVFVMSRKKIQYQSGEKIGNCIYLRDAEWDSYSKRKGVFICPYCDKEFIAKVYDIKSYHTKSCGCNKMNFILAGIITHNKTYSKEYRIWVGMKLRCYKKNYGAYKYYGARGIMICDDWLNDFDTFYNYITNLENHGKKGYTVDRINNDGNYEPGNIKYSTNHEQVANRGKIAKFNNNYIGVRKQNNANSWQARICINYKYINIGHFRTEKDALEARNKYIIDNDLSEYNVQKYKCNG